ncbi:hypothetical protein ACJX0J_026164, partial [Zea mays]
NLGSAKILGSFHLLKNKIGYLLEYNTYMFLQTKNAQEKVVGFAKIGNYSFSSRKKRLTELNLQQYNLTTSLIININNSLDSIILKHYS